METEQLCVCVCVFMKDTRGKWKIKNNNNKQNMNLVTDDFCRIHTHFSLALFQLSRQTLPPPSTVLLLTEHT